LRAGPGEGARQGYRGKLRTGEERGEGEESADSPGPAVRERGERERALGLRGRGSGPARGPCGGEREERGPGGRKKKGERKLGRANRVWVAFPPSSFPFLFYTQTFKQI
jgi:hypothetical protein